MKSHRISTGQNSKGRPVNRVIESTSVSVLVAQMPSRVVPGPLCLYCRLLRKRMLLFRGSGSEDVQPEHSSVILALFEEAHLIEAIPAK